MKQIYYTVIGPGTIHQLHKYNVAVALHDASETCQLNIGITGPSYNETKTVELTGGLVKMLQFDVPALEKGDYNLTAEGVTGVVFKNTTKLNYGDFKAIMKIQTDRGSYKPGDDVNFRVIFLNEHLRPTEAPTETVVWFEDARGNRITEYKNIKVTKGVYTNKFHIAEFPVLGDWRLYVGTGNDVVENVYFQVAKYVLPKYEVKVEATESVSVKDGVMQVVVRSNYTYGEPVNAKVTLSVQLSGAKSEASPTLIRTAQMVNGKAKFDLNVKEYEPFMDSNYASALILTTTVEENFTGVKLNATSYSSIYPYRYSMDCDPSECYSFEVDKEKDIHLKVKYIDGTTLRDTKSVVKLTYTEAIEKSYSYGEDKETKKVEPKIEGKQYVFESHLNETGTAVFNVKLSELAEFDNYTHFYKIQASYADENREVAKTFQYNPSNQYVEPTDYFRLVVQYEKDKYSYKFPQQAVITVNSSEPMSYFVYQIVGRGNILHSEHVALPDQPKTWNLTITPTFEMTPAFEIFAYYVNGAGNLTYTEASVNIDVELPNQIEITAPEKVKPGEDVSLRIKTEPNSFVGLAAVDKSSLLLRGANDLSENDFVWALNRFNTRTPWHSGFYNYPGLTSGVVTLTNANYEAANFGSLHNEKYGAPAPAAGVGAFGGGGGGAIDQDNIRVRQDFSETWLFADIENTETEEFTWSKKIPDTITSWVLTGFSLNPAKGLGVTKDSTKITTFQPFFVAIRLPYSVKRGEVISIPAVVFNYLDKNLDVEITLDNTDNEFEFTEVNNEVLNESKQTKTIRVSANSAEGASFMIRPKIIGNIFLKFSALSPLAGDIVHKTLKVVPEGVTEYANRAYFVNLKQQPAYKETFELQLPQEVVPDSEHIEFSVIGDLLGPLLNNLDNVLRLPLGCGEQITSTLLTNVMVMRYLKSLNKLTPFLDTKIQYNIQQGYQNLLRYNHADGSFSAFGAAIDATTPVNGSTWLTAYIVRTLSQVKEFVNIDEKIIKNALDYLSQQQSDNGSFVERGHYFYASQKELLTLTSSVLLAFHEYEAYESKFQPHVDKGYKYLLDNLEQSEEVLAKAIATFTLHQAKHAATKEHLANLKSLAKTDEDRKWWSHSSARKTSALSWWRWIYSSDVELTSYVLLVLLDQADETADSVLPIIKWLVAQRNNYGGFVSTQDTVVGLQALIKFATKFEYEPALMDVNFNTKGTEAEQNTMRVTEDNALIKQSMDLPPKTLAVDFDAKGKGAALVQISYQYNILEKDKEPAFKITNTLNKETPSHKLEMATCVEYIEGESSNMAILEVSLPSGYVADEESFEDIRKLPHVRLVETKNAESVIVVYFESLHKAKPVCLTVVAFKGFAVALQKPSSIVLYDYYDATKRATSYYEIDSKLCDLCDQEEDCKQKCASL